MIKKNKYFATVCRLTNVRPHHNADRLQIADALGYQVIVGLEAKEGDLGIVFPEGGRLSHEMAMANSLYRKHPETKEPMGGYFCENARIRTLKLRGANSEAYFASMDSLQWAFEADTKGIFSSPTKNLQEGDDFSEINGKVICQKYYTKATLRAINSAKSKYKKPWWVPSFLMKYHRNYVTNKAAHDPCPTFKKHFDTAKLRHSANLIPNDLICIWTVKSHGCVPAFSKIKMADGTLKEIRNIKKDDVVLGYDHQQNKCVPSKVLNTFINLNTDSWLKFYKTNENKKIGSAQQTLFCTDSHKVYTQKGYIPASEVQIGDTVFVDREILDISNKQDMLIGKALGDGSFDTHSSNFSLVFGSKDEHREYLDYCNKYLGNLGTQVIRSRVSGYGTAMLDSRTKQCKAISDFYKLFEADGERIRVPKNLKLSPTILAFWYMDDGSLVHNSTQKDRASIACCSFSDDDVEVMKQSLKDYGFSNFTFSKTGGYWRLRFNHSDAMVLFEHIKKYVPPVLQYKLSPEFKGFFDASIIPNDLSKIFKKYPEKIVKIERVKTEDVQASAKYDIETETSNFFCRSFLIHNSSGRTGLVPYDDRNWLQKLLMRPISYKKVTGTRNVVKNPNTFGKVKDDGYYSGTDFRYEAHKMIDGLKKGESVFYEILGWANDQTPIMPDHTIKWSDFKDSGFSREEFDQFSGKYNGVVTYHYGNGPGKFSIEVYRITQDGVDLNWNEMVKRCQELKLPTVKYLTTTGTDVDLMTQAKELADQSDNGQLREGVVLRLETQEGKMVKFFKYKSLAFCILEGIRNNEENYVNLEEIS